MSVEDKVANHYTRGRLEETILQAAMRDRKETEPLTAGNFATVDEFHVGGLQATEELATRMELHRGMRLLDIGCGIGGPARYFASEHGCKVTGVDLTEEFVQVANSLTRLVKLDDLVEFQQSNALELPFENGTFDRAYMLHVGMNIADKAGLCREAQRVLKPGGLFVVFDVMRTADGPMRYPVPWALNEETSFVSDIKDYRDAMEQAGLHIVQERRRGPFAVEFTRRAMARMAESGPPVLGLQLLVGDKTPIMMTNILAMMEEGLLEPVELFARTA
jgi:SAM-dependent methyltransferase